MNNQQENHLTMYDTVLVYLASRGDITSQLPVYAQEIALAHATRDRIWEVDAERDTIYKGFSSAKRRKRNELETILFKIAASVSYFGSANNEPDLTNGYDYNDSDIRGMRDQQIISAATILLNTARPKLTELAECGITAELLDGLEKERDDFAALVSGSGAAAAQGKAATANIKNLFKELRDIFENRLDKLADFMKADNPDFYAEYTAARRIIDRGIRHEEPEG